MTFSPNQTLISQYANSPRILALIDSFYEAIGAQGLIDSFYNLVWNLETAQGWGLDFWGAIVGVSRVLQVAGTGVYFGFTPASDAHNFADGTFYVGDPTTDRYALSDNAFRLLIYAKALANISDCSCQSINKILLALFPGRGNCYVQDNGDMTLTYVFDFTLSTVEISIVSTTGVLPRPAGIIANVTHL